MGANESAQARDPVAPPPGAPAPDGDMSALAEEFRAHCLSIADMSKREYASLREPVVRAFIAEFKGNAHCGTSNGVISRELGPEQSARFVCDMVYKHDVDADIVRKIVGDFLAEAFPPAPGEECVFFTDAASGGDAGDNFGVAFGTCE